MDAETLFANFVTIAIFVIVFIAVTGGNPDPLIELLPSFIIVVFVIAMVIAVINSI